MFGYFFEQLSNPKLDINLEVGSRTHAEQIVAELERLWHKFFIKRLWTIQ